MNLFQKITVASCVAMTSMLVVEVNRANAFSFTLESGGAMTTFNDDDNDHIINLANETIGGWTVIGSVSVSSGLSSAPLLSISGFSADNDGTDDLVLTALDNFTVAGTKNVNYDTFTSLTLGSEVTTKAFVDSVEFSSLNVLAPGEADETGTVQIENSYELKLVSTLAGEQSFENYSADVVLSNPGGGPIDTPEPLTMFSSLIALGFGGLLTKSAKDETVEEEA